MARKKRSNPRLTPIQARRLQTIAVEGGGLALGVAGAAFGHPEAMVLIPLGVAGLGLEASEILRSRKKLKKVM